MTRMLLLSALLLLSGACSQGHGDYIEANVGGRQVAFRAMPYAVISGVGGRMESLHVQARLDRSSAMTAFEISLQTPGADLRTTTYSSGTLRDREPRPGVGQSDSLLAQYYVPGGQRHYMSDGGNPDVRDFVLTITSIRNGRVEGTFSGGLRSDQDGMVEVTGGRFSMAYQHGSHTSW
jgi:hypothetical protein